MGSFHRLAPVRTSDHEGRAQRGQDGETFAPGEDTDRHRPHRLGAEQQARPARRRTLHRPGLRQKREHPAEQCQIGQLGPGRRAGGGKGVQARCRQRYAQDRSHEHLDGGQSQRAHGPACGQAADQRHMPRPYQRGPEYQQVAGAGGVEPAAGGQQGHGHQAQTGRGVEGGGEPAAVQERRQDDGQADDQSGVRGARVRDTVRLQHQDRRLRHAEERPEAEFVTRPTTRGATCGATRGPTRGATRSATCGATRSATRRDQADAGDRRDPVPCEQHDRHRQFGRGRLRRQVAGTPDDRDEEQDQVDAAVGRFGGHFGRCGGHGPYGVSSNTMKTSTNF